jgi:hypothetical protein
MIRSWGLIKAVKAAKLRSVYISSLTVINSLGGGSRVRLDVDTPDLGVEVESLQGSLSAEVLEDIDVL